jgi:STE24 endopeptidase
MGHYKKKHIRQSLILGILQTGLMLFLLSHFITYQSLFDAFYLPLQSVYAGMLFFAMLYAPIDFFVGILMQVLSRKNENAADRFAAETTKDPGSMVDVLKKLSVHNLSNLTPHPFYVFLNYSHPPVLKRIQSLST